MADKSVTLIINADDYGYFPCISQGIISAANAGKLTATGILANSPNLAQQLCWLDNIKHLDLGVHLNLSYGRPLTPALSEKFPEFPGVLGMMKLIVSCKVNLELIKQEWRAQIESCLAHKLVFLNAHEHIHMLPVLFPIAVSLAKDYQIPHVRLTRAEWFWSTQTTAVIRNSLIQAMFLLNQQKLKTTTPVFCGLSQSGKLNSAYLSRLFSRLQAGKTYELMCHPGFFNPQEITNPKLIHYHHWQQELDLLLSTELETLYKKFNIQLGYYPK